MSEVITGDSSNVLHFGHKMVRLSLEPSDELAAVLADLSPVQPLAGTALGLCSEKAMMLNSIEGRLQKSSKEKVINLRKAVLGSRAMKLSLVNDAAIFTSSPGSILGRHSEPAMAVQLGLALPRRSELGEILENFGLAAQGRLSVLYTLPDGQYSPSGIAGLDSIMDMRDPLTAGRPVRNGALYAKAKGVEEIIVNYDDE